MIEIWKDIKGFEGLYKISNKGSIKSLDRKVGKRTNIIIGKIISQRINHNGYKTVKLNKNSKRYNFFVHKIVCETFNGYEEGKQVNHVNFNKEDNRPVNLQWVTNSENIQYTYDNYMSEKQSIVLDYNNGIFYRSIREASEFNDIKKGNLRSMLIGRVKNKTSLLLV